jgi:3-oxo-5-alpha-steroid 4-dehydrogenase 1
MSLVQGWYPPSRENWELIAYAWQFFPLVRVYLTSTHTVTRPH